jgi:hypothetical protein
MMNAKVYDFEGEDMLTPLLPLHELVKNIF